MASLKRVEVMAIALDRFVVLALTKNEPFLYFNYEHFRKRHHICLFGPIGAQILISQTSRLKWLHLAETCICKFYMSLKYVF